MGQSIKTESPNYRLQAITHSIIKLPIPFTLFIGLVKKYGFLLSLIKIQIDKGDFIHSKYPLHIIWRKGQLSCPDMRHVKMGIKSREKNS